MINTEVNLHKQELLQPNVVPIEMTDQPGEDLGWGNFNIYNDWGTTQATWDGSMSASHQQEASYNEQVTLWGRTHYNSGNYKSYVGSTIDSAFSTFMDRGYLTGGLGARNVTITGTLDMSGNVYVGITTGNGITAAVGLTPQMPEGKTQADFLSGWSGTAILPGSNAGLVTTEEYTAPIWGSHTVGPSWNIKLLNYVDIASEAANSFLRSTKPIFDEALRFFNQLNAIPDGSNVIYSPYDIDNSDTSLVAKGIDYPNNISIVGIMQPEII